jgi:hypothetical protein
VIRIAINGNYLAFILINNSTDVFLDFFPIQFGNQTISMFYSKNKMDVTLIIGIGHICYILSG